MATLSSKHLNDPVKVLNLGDSGGGKTGALASLVTDLGLELFILDFDNGTDILESLIVKPEHRTKVHVETLTDAGKMMAVGASQKIVKLSPQAFAAGLNLLNRWIDRETRQDFGPVTSWGSDRVLVVDSLTFMGTAALDFVLAQNGRGMGQQPFEGDWGEAMKMLEQVLQILFSTEVKCHVVINTHVDYQQAVGDIMARGLPMALGKKLAPKVGRFFNFIIITKSRGDKRVLLTKSEGLIEAKCPLLDAPRELPIESGLAQLFKLWIERGKTLNVSTPQVKTA